MRNRGFSLIVVIFLISAVILLLASASYMVFSSSSSLKAQKDYLAAYYLAEAGVEYGKAQLRSNPAWCTPGITIKVTTGSIEIKKEPAKPYLYGIGNAGQGRVIIKLNVIDHNSYIQREE